MTYRSQIDTRLDAHEFLTGQWALQPSYVFTEDELADLTTDQVLTLARKDELIIRTKKEQEA